jgi:hypothetical protein
MVESLSPHPLVEISRELTAEFRASQITPELLEKLENESHANLNYRPEEIISVRIADKMSGPEKPKYCPDPEDLDPTIQIIATAGNVSRYWRNMSNALNENRVDAASFVGLSEIILFENPDRTSTFPIITDNDVTNYKVRRYLGKKAIRYQAFIPLINYAGDADFMGTKDEKRFIFPQHVNGCLITADELGIPGDLAKDTWYSWHNAFEAYHKSYEYAVRQLFKRKDLPINTLTFLGSYSYHNKIHGPYRIEEALHPHLNIPQTDFVIQAANENYRKLIYESGDPNDLLGKVQNLAYNMEILYEAARNYRRDVYKY